MDFFQWQPQGFSAWVSLCGETEGAKGFEGTQWVPTNKNALSGGILFKKCVCLIFLFQEPSSRICSPTFSQQTHGRASVRQKSLEKGSQGEVQLILWPDWGLWLFCFVFILRQTILEHGAAKPGRGCFVWQSFGWSTYSVSEGAAISHNFL